MATLGPTGTTTDVTSFANFATWAGTGAFGINTALTNFGWTRTPDLNQIFWTVTLTLTSVANASAGTTVYTGTITGGGANAFAGITFVVAGFTNGANNGTFLCSASTTTTLTLNNAGGVAETHAATATSVTGAPPFSGAAGTTYPLTNQPAGSYLVNTRGLWVTSTIYAPGDVTFDSITNSSYYLSPATFLFAISSCANASAGSTVYTGTITGGAANAYAGSTFTVTGFGIGGGTTSTGVSNGTYTCTASTTTTITLSNPNGVAESPSPAPNAKIVLYNSTVAPSTDTGHWIVYHYESWQTNDSATFAQTAQAVSYVASTQTLTVATNTTPNRLKAGFIVTISGASNFPQINGTWTVTSATTTSLTFTIPNTLTGFTGNFSGTDSFSVAYSFQPICMKLEYWGNTSPYSTCPWVRLSFGTGTDGIGNLTGNVVGSSNSGTQVVTNTGQGGYGFQPIDLVSSQTGPSGAQTSTIWRCIASGSNGRFGTALWYNRNDTQVANNQSTFWIVERSKDDVGNDTDDYFTYLCGVRGDGITGSFNTVSRFCQQRSILKWNPIVNITTVTVDSSNDLIVWYNGGGGAGSYQFAIGANVLFGGLDQATFLNDQILTIPTVSLTLTSVANASGGSTVYTGTITGGTTNAYLNQKVTVTGFTNAANNGTFTCTASTATTITLNNASGTSETHAATVSGNFFIIPFTHAAFTTAAETGTLRLSTSTATFTPIAGTGLPCLSDPNICTIQRGLTTLTVNGIAPLLPVFPVPGFLGNPMTMAQAYSQGDAPAHDTTTTITLYGATRTYYFPQGTGAANSNTIAPYNTFGEESQNTVNAFVLRWD